MAACGYSGAWVLHVFHLLKILFCGDELFINFICVDFMSLMRICKSLQTQNIKHFKVKD